MTSQETGNVCAPIRLLLVDDHPVVSEGLSRLLDGEPDLVVRGVAHNGEQAYQLYSETQPDVVIMDLVMPGIGGLEVSRRILARDPRARILAFTVHDSEVIVNKAVELGILGFVTKASPPAVLIEAIRRVVRDQAFFGEDPAHYQEVPHGGGSDRLAALTSRQLEVLCLLGSGKTVPECADILHLSSKTVSNYLTYIKHQLNVQSAAELARIAIRHGLIEA